MQKTYTKAELDAAVAVARLESFEAGLDLGAKQKLALNDFEKGKAIAASIRARQK